VARQRGEHGVVGDGVAAGHGVEQAPRRRQLARPREAGELLVAPEHRGGGGRRHGLGGARGGHESGASARSRQSAAASGWRTDRQHTALLLDSAHLEVADHLENRMDWA